MSSTRPHPPGCLCSSCNLASKLFPRGPNDRIILPAIRSTPDNTSKSSGNDHARFAPSHPQSAPHPYRPRQPAPSMPSPPRGYDDHSRRSMDAHRAPFVHRLVPTHVSAAHTSDSVCADPASRGATMNGTAFTHALPHRDTSNTAEIDGSMSTSLDRNTRITIYGGQGGNGGEGGGTGGNGGAGEGNQLQIHLAGETTLNVYYGGRDRDLDFVVDMLTCLAWLGLSTLAVVCLHRLGWFDIGEVRCA
ncbi:hypothetical protein C8R44DRAFT_806890 [Mycena epipterygia]|nr:hypothetical protein C8R44DRAFT_806890 [Mycena epipterygia]